MCVYIIDQVSDTFVPVTCGRAHLEAMHRMEVFIKRWSAPIGNQYFKSIMPDVNIKLCSGCNKVYLPYAFNNTELVARTGLDVLWVMIGAREGSNCTGYWHQVREQKIIYRMELESTR